MLREGQFDVLEFTPPSEGMNRKVSSEILTGAYAYHLENVVTEPLGCATVRCGTSLVYTLPDAEATILGQFPFVKADGSEQIILYTQVYTRDDSASSFVISRTNPSQFSFTTSRDAPERVYLKDLPLKITYDYNGSHVIYDTIAQITVSGRTITLTLPQNIFPQTAQITALFIGSGTLYALDVASSTLSDPLREQLSVTCIPRSVTFLDTLLLCNGVDRVLSWDGADLRDVSDFVRERTQSLTRVNDHTLSFISDATFNLRDYHHNHLLKLETQGVTTQVKITHTTFANNLVTVTTQEVLPILEPTSRLSYQAFPPAFSFILVAHNRLWALGQGAAELNYRSSDQALIVYHTYRPNSMTQWFNEQDKAIPTIDLSANHGEPDNLEAICQIGGYTAFVGRKKTQLYQGRNPVTFQEGGDFIFHSILNTGIIHGDLLINLANDVFFVTKNGFQSFGTLNIGHQFAATSHEAIDSMVQDYVSAMTSSDLNYRSASAFKYEGAALAGFKIGRRKVLVSQFSTNLKGWTVFSGDFERAQSYLTMGNCLYLSIKNQIYKYADGKDGSPIFYGDRGGKDLIYYNWTLPIISFKGRRFAGKRYELESEYPSSFTVDPANKLDITIRGDLPKSYEMTQSCRFELRGDRLNTIPLTQDAAPTDASLGFRFDQPYHFFKDRLKFLASKFWLTVSGWAKDGEISLKKIKLFGIIERK